MEEQIIVRSVGGGGASQMINAVEGAVLGVQGLRMRESWKDARRLRRKADRKQEAVIKYLESVGQTDFDPSVLAQKMRAAKTATSQRERAQNEAIDAAQFAILAAAMAAAGRLLTQNASGDMGYYDDRGAFVALGAGFAGFALAKLWDDDKDDDDRDDD